MSEPREREEHGREETLRLIIDEVDEARDVFELVSQLRHALPIRNFDELRAACGEDGTLAFRGSRFSVVDVEPLLPYWAFPVEDTRALVQRVADAVRITPPDLAVDHANPDFIRRQARRQLLTGIPNGLPRHVGSLQLLGPPFSQAPLGQSASLEPPREAR